MTITRDGISTDGGTVPAGQPAAALPAAALPADALPADALPAAAVPAAAMPAAPRGTAPAARLTEHWAFRDEVRLDSDGSDLRVLHRWGGQVLRRVSPALAAALGRLAAGPASIDELGDGLLSGRPDRAAADRDLAYLHWALGRLQGVMVRSIALDGRPMIRVVPVSPQARLAPAAVRDATLLRLSRFAYLHQRDGVLAAESPLSLHRVELCSPESAAVAACLGHPVTPASLAAAGVCGRGAGHQEVLTAILSCLLSAGIAQAATGNGGPAFAEDADAVLRQWAFHDLLFHSRSRLGRHDDDFGATFPFLGELDPQPAVKRVPDGVPVPLPRPDLASMLERDAKLTAVMEARRSVRSYDERPPTLAEVGELLYRTARVRATLGPDRECGMPYPASDRPYPCGGAAYDIELYLTIHRCEGLERANYYYDPVAHQLILVSRAEADVEPMLQRAVVSCGGATTPDVLITMTARFQRLGWKYRGMAYAATLKHVGVLYQTLYLVATAMGLAPCGLGSGDADMAARAFGLDWARESSVGEFMIGRRPADLPADPSGNSSVASYQPVNDPQWAAAAARLIPRGTTPAEGTSEVLHVS